jgi:hypothetical protein
MAADICENFWKRLMQPYRTETRKERKLRHMEEEDGGWIGGAINHSGAYHRFFEGHSEEVIRNKSGKRAGIVRVYVGEYYSRKCSDREYLLAKATYVFLYCVAAIAYLFALTRPTESNMVWYTAVPGLLSVVPMILLFVKTVNCTMAKRRMKAYEYKVFKKLFLLCVITAGFLCVTALMVLLFIILNSPADTGKEFVPCIFCILGACMILAIGIVERRARYERLENPNIPTENSIIIC